jgi:glycopeptide antibiotics resistance protein
MATESCGSLIHCGSKLAGEVVAVLPVGILIGMLLGTRRSLWIAALAGCVLGVIIEGVQLFIESGTTQGISMLIRSAGAMLGMCLYGLSRKSRPMRRSIIGGGGAGHN